MFMNFDFTVYGW